MKITIEQSRGFEVVYVYVDKTSGNISRSIEGLTCDMLLDSNGDIACLVIGPESTPNGFTGTTVRFADGVDTASSARAIMCNVDLMGDEVFGIEIISNIGVMSRYDGRFRKYVTTPDKL